MDIGDMTLDEYGDLMEFLGQMSNATMSHAVVFFVKPDHACDADDIALFQNNVPEVDPEDILRYFAWESSVKEMMSQTRLLFAARGYPIEEHISDGAS